MNGPAFVAPAPLPAARPTPHAAVGRTPAPARKYITGCPVRGRAPIVFCAEERAAESGVAPATAPISRRSLAAALAALAAAPVAANAIEFDKDLLPPPKVDQNLPDFITLPSGLKVQELGGGDASAATPAPGKTLAIHYVIRRSNGYFVDATYGFDRTQRYKFVYGQGEVIPGLEEVLADMRVGQKRRAIIPPEKGYRDADGKFIKDIGPVPPDWGNARSLAKHSRENLVFEVRLLDVL
eukprot:tig00001331_g8168.t1